MKKKLIHKIPFLILLVFLLSGCGLMKAREDNTPDLVGDLRSEEHNQSTDIEDENQELRTSSNEEIPLGEPVGEAGQNAVPLFESEKSEPSTFAPMDSSGSNYPPSPVFTATPPGNPPRDMFFEDYGVNPFIDTEDDNLSTFATDVDTGSYTIARSYINQGMLPPEDSVRVEEYINYFPQDYPLPSSRETFMISIDGAPTPFTETDRYHVIRVGIQGYDIQEDDRKDVSLTFVIDVSGSMGNGNRLEMVQDALELLVDQLGPSDSVGIVAYTDTAWVVLPHTSARNKSEIIEAIYSLYPMASTNAEAGLILGYREANKAFLSNGINRVILCSDGVANVGNTGPDSIWESIEDYASEGITLTSVGVGMGNYNDVLMEQLADQGNGFYAYIDNMNEARRLFVHDLVSTLQVIALDAKAQVIFNPEVVSRYRLVGFENRAIADEDFRNNRVDAAEIGAGHSVTALYEIKLNSGAWGEIATVQLRWKNPDTYRVEEISKTIDTRDLEDSFRRADPYFKLDVLVAEFGEILRNSYWADGTSIQDVLEYAKDLPDTLERGEVYEFIDLLEQAVYLDYRR
ncbi:MAG: von Willebrand factor type A domain-containing protein [Anaerolineales bacterium]